MSFIEEHLDGLKPRIPDGRSFEETAAEGFLYPWNHDNADMDLMLQALRILQPKVVMELGTFEAWGTLKMARCLNWFPSKSFLYTFDAGHSPANSLGGSDVYGVPEQFEEVPLVDWRSFPKNHKAYQGWGCWGKVINARNKRLKEMSRLPNVEVKYVEGITYDTLPKVMPEIGVWDFCFQDTLHKTHHIIKEWKLYREFTKVGSLVVFDNITPPENLDFVDWFKENEPNWIYKRTEVGDGQLWAERIK
jgi:predicted O-methyltransferase YrrM